MRPILRVTHGGQHKEQLDPSEGVIYVVGSGRRIFQTGLLTFGIVICQEVDLIWKPSAGPLDVAQVVFHPHAHVAEPGAYRPTKFLEPGNIFHEKAMHLYGCR